jgi:hypothetical protein
MALFFLTSALNGVEPSASRPYRFTPEDRASGIQWIGGWVDPRTGLDGVEKRKILHFPQRRPEFEPRSDYVGFVRDKVALGNVFSEYFSFPCQFSFH